MDRSAQELPPVGRARRWFKNHRSDHHFTTIYIHLSSIMWCNYIHVYLICFGKCYTLWIPLDFLFCLVVRGIVGYIFSRFLSWSWPCSPPPTGEKAHSRGALGTWHVAGTKSGTTGTGSARHCVWLKEMRP